jgi:AAA15 family ATPase/GTPase
MCNNYPKNNCEKDFAMLLEFSVTNYRSIRDTQTLRMTASKYYKGLEDTNCFDADLVGLPQLLRTAVIYGPNTAGKSNLVRALHFMQMFVLLSHSHQEGQEINAVPFALNGRKQNEPCEFEIFFVQDNIRYQYGFAASRVRITKEWLLAFPEGKAQRWYEREYDAKADKDRWYFGSRFTGRRQLWQEATRKNALFLSTAIQLNNEQLKPVFGWFQDKLAVILPGAQINLQLSIDQCSTEEGTQRIMRFLNSADIGIAGIEIKKIPLPPMKPEMLPPDMPQPIKEQVLHNMQGKEVPHIQFIHKTSVGESVPFLFSDESDGTKKLFAFAGPWLDVLAKGRILICDELDTSLHPLMVRFLIGLIQNPQINKHNAQLIFTTHDTSILDADFFRRDQVWFAEKDREQASRLYPLSDFKPRKGEALEKGYLNGRYGALPFIGELRF